MEQEGEHNWLPLMQDELTAWLPQQKIVENYIFTKEYCMYEKNLLCYVLTQEVFYCR